MKQNLIQYTDEQKGLILESIQFLSRFFWGIDSQLSETIFEGGLSDWLHNLENQIDSDISIETKKINTGRNSCQTKELYQAELETIFVKLFINDQGGVTAPLYQSCYQEIGAMIMGESANEMRRRLERLNIMFDHKVNEPPDHLAIELEYLACLLERAWGEENVLMQEESAEFISHHLLPWINQLHQRIADVSFSALILPFVSILQKILLHMAPV